MTQPLISLHDEPEVRRITQHLPHALILVAEPGLDSAGVVESIISSTPSQVLRVSPEETKKSISVEQVRALAMNVRTTTSMRRVLHITPADAMTEEAQNALLKLLEEPAEAVHLLLETTSLEGLLPTIISRSQIVTLSRTSPHQDDELLADSSFDDQTKQQVRFLAAGRPALIRQMIAQPELLEQYRHLAADAKQIISGNTYEALRACFRHSGSREQALQLIDVVATILKFGAKRRGVDPQTRRLVDNTHAAIEALNANGNIKLTLLRLVAR